MNRVIPLYTLNNLHSSGVDEEGSSVKKSKKKRIKRESDPAEVRCVVCVLWNKARLINCKLQAETEDKMKSEP